MGLEVQVLGKGISCQRKRSISRAKDHERKTELSKTVSCYDEYDRNGLKMTFVYRYQSKIE